MATKVVMEALSPTMEEGRLVEWKKQEGEPVAAGDVLAEVETDKAGMELVARVSGVLLRQTVKAGQTVPVSTPVAVIGAPGETVAAGDGAGGDTAKRAGGPPAPGSEPGGRAVRRAVCFRFANSLGPSRGKPGSGSARESVATGATYCGRARARPAWRPGIGTGRSRRASRSRACSADGCPHPPRRPPHTRHRLAHTGSSR